MIKASDMLKLSKESATTIIDEIFEKSDFKEHSLKRIQEEARCGKLLYELHFDRGRLLADLRDMLLDKLEPIIKEFEDNGFKILIRDYGNGRWSNISVKFYWGDSKEEWYEIISANKNIIGTYENLYVTE